MSAQAPRPPGGQDQQVLLGALVVNLLLALPFGIAALRGDGLLPWLATAAFALAAAASGTALLVARRPRGDGPLGGR